MPASWRGEGEGVIERERVCEYNIENNSKTFRLVARSYRSFACSNRVRQPAVRQLANPSHNALRQNFEFVFSYLPVQNQKSPNLHKCQ